MKLTKQDKDFLKHCVIDLIDTAEDTEVLKFGINQDIAMLERMNGDK